MRLHFLAALVALLPLPALADVTARYSAGTDVLLVEVDDGGDSRIGIEGKFSIIHRDGVDYVVRMLPGGGSHVTRLADALGLFAELVAGPAPAGGAKELAFRLVPQGEVRVGAWSGSAWSFGPDREADGRPGETIELAVSADPALAPVGTVFRRLVDLLLPVIRIAIPGSADFGPKALDLAAKGTVLRIGTTLELQSITTDAIDSRRFDLPGPVIAAAEFMGALGMADQATIEIKPLP